MRAIGVAVSVLGIELEEPVGARNRVPPSLEPVLGEGLGAQKRLVLGVLLQPRPRVRQRHGILALLKADRRAQAEQVDVARRDGQPAA